MSCASILPSQGASLEGGAVGSYKQEKFENVYVIGKQIGEGTFGNVYETHHLSSPKERFAVKIMCRESESDESVAIREASIMYHLRDVPNVVQLVDFYTDAKQLYSVQILAAGGDVFERLVRNETYTEKCARDLAKVLLTTVDHIHQRRVVHRDLKLENLLLKSQHNDTDILVCDFDNAKVLKHKDERMRTLCGTEAYMAPEVMRNSGDYGMECDMWSVGCILFCILGGYLPFGDGEYGDLHDRVMSADIDFDDECWDVVSNDATDLICHLILVDPDERYTAKQALNSDWFLQARESKLLQSNLWRSLSNIRGYYARRKFKAAVHAVQLSNKLKNITGVGLLNKMRNTCEGKAMCSASSLDDITETETETEFGHDSMEEEGFPLVATSNAYGERYTLPELEEEEIETETETDMETEPEKKKNLYQKGDELFTSSDTLGDDPLEQLREECQKQKRQLELELAASQAELWKVKVGLEQENQNLISELNLLKSKHQKEKRQLKVRLAVVQDENDKAQKDKDHLQEERDNLLLELDTVQSERDQWNHNAEETEKQVEQMKNQRKERDKEVSRQMQQLQEELEQEKSKWKEELEYTKAEKAKYQNTSTEECARLEEELVKLATRYLKERKESKTRMKLADEERKRLQVKCEECRNLKQINHQLERERNKVLQELESSKVECEQLRELCKTSIEIPHTASPVALIGLGCSFVYDYPWGNVVKHAFGSTWTMFGLHRISPLFLSQMWLFSHPKSENSRR